MQQWAREDFPYFEKCIQHINSKKKIHRNLKFFVIDALNPKVVNNLLADGGIILTNNYVEHGIVPDNRFLKFPNSWYGIYAGQTKVTPRPAIKNFNCFINRMDPIRQSWLYLLIRRDLFQDGYISFNMDISQHRRENVYPSETTAIEIFQHEFEKYCSIFLTEHNFIKTKVPYKNFHDDLSLCEIIMNSKFSIVLETYHHDNRFITFSEKIFRCLKLPRPWVVHAAKGAAEHLRNIGFDVLDDIVDHSYDNINFTIERQSAILDQCEKLSMIDIDSINARLNIAAENNCRQLEYLYNTWLKDVDDTVAEALTMCDNGINY